MTDKPLRVGVIGVGFGTTVHAPAFLSEGWDVVALCSRTKERVRAAADHLGIREWHTDHRELVARDDIDAVAIATPPASHSDAALAALEAGKHVLCEKPFALDLTQARTIAAAAEQRGLTGMLAHEFRFTPQRAYVKELLDQGYLGAPTLVTIEGAFGQGGGQVRPYTWQAQASQGGGSLGALGSHYIDGLRYWLGDVKAVTAHLTTLRPERVDLDTGETRMADADDTFLLTLEFGSGCVGQVSFTTAASVATGLTIRVHGTEGTLATPQRGLNPAGDGIVLGAKADEGQPQELPMPGRLTALKDDRDNRLAAFRILVREFERGIREGTSPAPSFADGIACQAVLDAARQSAATGQRMAVETA